jgi:hypothetical protein
MGILDNDTVIVDAILTKIGRQKLAQGQPLGISKFAFGDTGVDYTLYNPNHPSGSDSYGNAITNLPMLEAVPDDNVFLRSKLYGTGERNVQNFSFITVENTSPTITKKTGKGAAGASNAINIIPNVWPEIANAVFNFKILDARGIRINGNVATQPFSHPDPVTKNVSGKTLTLNAESTQFTSQKSFGVEVTREGTAPTFITVTVAANNTVSS